MPPIPFAPSHQSPFKSTLSSSQQSRTSHSSDLEAIELSVQDIVPSQWTYHCEGGKNVLLSLDPRSESKRFIIDNKPLALRIAKSSREATVEDDEADRFTQEVITPLLGNQSLLPLTITLPLRDSRDKGIIDTIAAAIEVHRPAARRQSSTRIDPANITHVHAIENVTAPTLHHNAGTLCVELKPKWGFLPRIGSIPPSSPYLDIKARYSRYKMHRVAKSAAAGDVVTAGQFDDLYDPLDLYSHDECRRKKAVVALYRDWLSTGGATNNFRLFWNGSVVAPHDKDTIATIGDFLKRHSDPRTKTDDKLLEGVSTLLISELSKPRVPPLSPAQQPSTVLDRLAFLQSTLDPFDVEGLSHTWLELSGSQTLGNIGPSLPQLDPASALLLSSPPSVDDLKSCLTDMLTFDAKVEIEAVKTPAKTLVRHIYRFLLSSTFKDCSLLIRCDKTNDGELQTSTKVIDLDMKPFAKLAKFQATDELVCSEFLKWKAGLKTEPVASRV